MTKKVLLILTLFSFLAFISFFSFVSAPSLNCSIVLNASCANTKVLFLENETQGYNNAHAQNVTHSGYTDYDWVVCCDANVIGDTVTTACPTIFLKLSDVTNAHVQIPSWNTYTVNVCIDTVSGSVHCTNRTTDCLANETCLVSMASSEGDNTTNAHVASCSYYTTKICCTLNSPPSTTTPSLVPDPAYTKNDLNCSFTVTDPDTTSLYANYTWYRNDSAYLSGQVAATNNTLTKIQLLNGNTTKNENWTCQITPYDGELYGTAKNSSTIKIINTPPSKVNLSRPLSESHTTNRTPYFNWTISTDDDDDTIQYVWNLTCWNSAGGSCSPADNRVVENLTVNEYTPTAFLKNFWDTNEYYNWTVKAWDSGNFSDVSDMWRFYIDALVAITAINDSVNFSTLDIDQTDNTTDNLPYPISMYNDGNCFINVTLNGTALWQSVTFPSSYYKFKADYLESNSFNWAQSLTEWTNVPDSALKAIAELNWSDLQDSYENDILVTVPSNEPPGAKSSSLTFTGLFTDVAE